MNIPLFRVRIGAVNKDTVKLICIPNTMYFKTSEAVRLICVMSRPIITDDFPSSELLTDATRSFTQSVEWRTKSA